MKFLITTSPGIEEENIKELFELTQKTAELRPGGVLELDTDHAGLFRILCGSFLSSRVLMPLGNFHAWEREVLYLETKKIPWDTLIRDGETFICDVHGSPQDCDYSAAQGLLKVKDAIVDQIREKRGSRPDVDKENPTHQIELFFWKGRTEISIDLCGEPLHRRGYRKHAGDAPLRESRAAALLRMAGLTTEVPERLYDPFCGSGTIAIEAAMMMRKIPPASRRYIPKKSFIENFHANYLETLNSMRADALPSCPTQIFASDLDGRIIPPARRAAETVGVASDIQFETMDFAEQDYKKGIVVSNPPYGERLEDIEAAKAILGDFGRKMKFGSEIERMTLLVNHGHEMALGLKPTKKAHWRAGPLDLVAATFHLWKGPRKLTKSPEEVK